MAGDAATPRVARAESAVDRSTVSAGVRPESTPACGVAAADAMAESGRAAADAAAEVSGPGAAVRRPGVTAAVHDAGIVAQRAGTALTGAGTVSVRTLFAVASCALPAFSQANAPGTPSAATAISAAARRLVNIIVD